MQPSECYERVERCVREAFGEFQREGDSTLVVRGGPYGIRITVSGVGDSDEAVVDVYTWLGRNVTVTPDIACYLLERNALLRFGSLAVDPSGDILLGYALFPEHLDAGVMTKVVRAIAVAADEFETELEARFR